MRIVIAAVARLRREPERDLFEAYAKRLKWPLTLKEVEEKRPISGPERQAREADLLLAAIPDGSTVVALDERGRTLDSAAFAKRLGDWQDRGVADLAFVVGGADGLDKSIRERADLVLSFGSMTWPHKLVRVMLAEQLYRAQTILAGHPYHRG